MAYPGFGNAHFPITRIPEDILWFIFTMNADMETPLEKDILSSPTSSSYSALDTIRHSSQVCQSWRNLLLHSPSVWGQVIRIDWLDQLRDDWRNEVMRRTGDSLLYVKGRVHGLYPSVRAFFAELLSVHWDRIRKIEVYIPTPTLFDESLWKVFLRPALHLEVFQIFFGHQRQLFEGQAIFADQAPLLRIFSCQSTGFSLPVHYSLSAPWLPQLRSVYLSRFSANEIMIAIRHMPLLEYLDLGLVVAPPTPIQRPIILPHLSGLRLTERLKTCLIFADTIKPSASCTLFLKSFDAHPEGITVDEIASTSRVLSRYSEMYFASRHVESFSLNADDAVTIIDSQGIPNDSRFHIEIHSAFRTPGLISAFLPSFSKCDFSNVKSFDFVPDRHSGLEELTIDTVNVVRSLESVDTLKISEYGLVVIMAFPENDDIVFPLLRHLTLKCTGSPHQLSFSTPRKKKTVERFLISRRDYGIPITKLDISQDIAGEPSDWGFLESIAGLKVVWGTGGKAMEYTCGSGVPETLDFRIPVDEDGIQN